MISRLAYERCRHGIGIVLLAGLTSLLIACASPPPTQQIVQRQVTLLPSVGEVDLLRNEQLPPEDALLDIGILIFDVPRVYADATRPGEDIYQEIAANEAHYLPTVLRNTLVESNQWGAIRVLPSPDPSLDLTLRGELQHSDGLDLQLHLVATDSTGREWINKTYRDATRHEDYPGPDPFLRAFRDEPVTGNEDPFADIYRQISNDLVAARGSLSSPELQRVNQVTDMRYAADLSPDMFGRYLVEAADGWLAVQGLPSLDDPMLRRVYDIQLRHHVFIDTIDEYYLALHDDMRAPYDLWRRYSRDQTIEDRTDAQRDPVQLASDAGSFSSLSQSYNRYMWAKMFAQEFRALSTGFNREVAPAILTLNNQVHGLTGPVEEQYAQWRDILRQIFELETRQMP